MIFFSGKLVCIIVEEQSDIAAFKDFKDDATPAAAAKATPAAPAPPSPVAAPPPPVTAPPAPPAAAVEAPGGRVYVSPMAKRLAEQRNIRLQGKNCFLILVIYLMK